MADQGYRPGLIRQFLGIRNTISPIAIPYNALSDAVDVRIDDAGAVLVRDGYSKSIDLAGATAGFSTESQVGYVVSDGILCRIGEGLSPIQLCPSSASKFCEVGGIVFTNDGLKVTNGGVINLRMPIPTQPLELVKIPGNLPKGTYSAMYCWANGDGMESGSSPVSSIDLNDNEGFTAKPIHAPDGYEIKMYFTDCNGTVFADNDNVPISPSQVLAESFPEHAETVAYFESSLFASETLPSGYSVVRFSKPFFHHLWDFASDYFILHGEVRGMIGAGQALVIATDNAIYAYSSESGVQVLANYGVPRGKPIAKLPNGQVMIHSLRGECIALPFENLTEKKVSLPSGFSCSTAVVQKDGLLEFLVLTDGSGTGFNGRY